MKIDREAEHKRLGLDPDCPTGIVLFGGHGSTAMVDIARELEQVEVQLIMICGHNDRLAAKLKSLPTLKPVLVMGFATNVEYYMALADFFIGKPGPGSISEALQLHSAGHCGMQCEDAAAGEIQRRVGYRKKGWGCRSQLSQHRICGSESPGT